MNCFILLHNWKTINAEFMTIHLGIGVKKIYTCIKINVSLSKSTI